MWQVFPLLMTLMVVAEPAPAADWVVPVQCPPMKNCWLESTPQLPGGWERDDHFTVLSNGDWRIERVGPQRFYRVAGEPL